MRNTRTRLDMIFVYNDISSDDFLLTSQISKHTKESHIILSHIIYFLSIV